MQIQGDYDYQTYLRTVGTVPGTGQAVEVTCWEGEYSVLLELTIDGCQIDVHEKCWRMPRRTDLSHLLLADSYFVSEDFAVRLVVDLLKDLRAGTVTFGVRGVVNGVEVAFTSAAEFVFRERAYDCKDCYGDQKPRECTQCGTPLCVCFGLKGGLCESCLDNVHSDHEVCG